MRPAPRATAAPVLLAAAALALTACGGSSTSGSGGGGSSSIAVKASDSSCEVSRTDLTAGTHTFAITNTGSKTTEVYLYAPGDKIVAEKENIAPGLQYELTAQVPQGSYEVATGKITGEEEAFSHTDLVDFAANVNGAQQAFTVLRPIVAQSTPDLVGTLDKAFADVQGALKPYATADGYVSYDTVTEDQRRELARVVDALSEPLSQLAASVAR